MACPSASAPLDMLCSSRVGLMFRSLLWGPSVFFLYEYTYSIHCGGWEWIALSRQEKKYDTTMLINTNWKGSDPDRCTIGNSLYKLLSGFFRQKTSLANYPICIISWKKKMETIPIYSHKNPVHILLQRMHKWKSVQALGLFILKN